MPKNADKTADVAAESGEESLQHDMSNVEQNEVVSNADHKVEGFETENGEGGGADRALFGVAEDVSARAGGDEAVADNDPRVEARDIVHSGKTRELARRTAEARGENELSVEELIKSVPA